MPHIARRALGRIMPALAVVALAGCTASVQPDTLYSVPKTAPVPPGWAYRNGGYYAPVAPPVVVPVPAPDDARPAARHSFIPPAQAEIRQLPVDPSPLRLPVAVDPPRFLPPVTLLTPPADATDCTGWWRICHLY
jgi:hypothetical protein